MLNYYANDYLARIHVLAFSILLVVLCQQAIAAESGRVQLNGREVILFDDNTWKFSNETTSSSIKDCVLIKSTVVPFNICLDDKIWKNGESNGAAELSFATKDDTLFLLVITDTDDIQLDAFEKAIVANAQSVAGKNPVVIRSNERLDAHGIEWGRMVYDGDIEELKIRYENYFTTLIGKGSVQYVFYTTPDQYQKASIQIGKASSKIGITK